MPAASMAKLMVGATGVAAVCFHCLIVASIAAAGSSSGDRIAPCSNATVFAFGDSYSDTGNNNVLFGNATVTAHKPYGNTFPGYPFRRFSDGRLHVDYLATYLGVSFLNPYLNASADFSSGVNYAVSGATALNTSELSKFSIVPSSNCSLDVQLQWHLAFKANVECLNDTTAGKPALSSFESGLYVIEIGRNDYAAALESNYTASYVNATFTQWVIQKIRSVTEVLYNNGARNFLYIGVPAMGCSSSFLVAFNGSSKNEDGCLIDHNSIAYTYGVKLLLEVESLRATYPLATFSFADHYGAYMYVLKNKASFGFVNKFDACCGAGAAFAYNYNPLLFCNENSSSLCLNPNNYINWDGIHYTDAFDFQISNQTFISGSFLNPSNGLIEYCSMLSSEVFLDRSYATRLQHVSNIPTIMQIGVKLLTMKMSFPSLKCIFS